MSNAAPLSTEVATMVAAVMAMPRPTFVSEKHECCSTTFTSTTDSDRTPAAMHADYHAARMARRLESDGVVDTVAYDAEGEDGLAWSCPECGVGGTNEGGEGDHNRYAHRATVTLEDGVYYVKPASEWGGYEDLAYRAAIQYPGLTFAMACECADDGEPMDDGDNGHAYGCGETFTMTATRLVQN